MIRKSKELDILPVAYALECINKKTTPVRMNPTGVSLCSGFMK
jgi:hypothetical protein